MHFRFQSALFGKHNRLDGVSVLLELGLSGNGIVVVRPVIDYVLKGSMFFVGGKLIRFSYKKENIADLFSYFVYNSSFKILNVIASFK